MKTGTERSGEEVIYKWYPIADEELAKIRQTFTPDQLKFLLHLTHLGHLLVLLGYVMFQLTDPTSL